MLGWSKASELNLVRQLKVWLHWMGLSIQPGCLKRLRRKAICPVCPQLFPKMCKTAWDPLPPQ